MTASVGSRMRLGLEVLHASMFGAYQYKRRAALVTPLFEYEFSPGSRINPYLVVGGGYTQYRSLYPNPRAFFDPSLPEYEWEKGGSFNLGGGLGLRLFLTKRLFVSPEVRLGILPVVRSTVAVGYRF